MRVINVCFGYSWGCRTSLLYADGRISHGDRANVWGEQCDEAKPQCIRCSRSDSHCRYRDYDELVFRDETKATASRAKMQWRTRILADENDSDKSSEFGVSKSTLLDESDWSFGRDLDWGICTSPRPAIVEPLLYRARKRFFYDFVFPGDLKTYRAPFLNFVPEMLEENDADSCLSLAVDALSLANFSKRRYSPETGGVAMQVYGRAMNSTNAAIADPLL